MTKTTLPNGATVLTKNHFRATICAYPIPVDIRGIAHPHRPGVGTFSAAVVNTKTPVARRKADRLAGFANVQAAIAWAETRMR